MDLPGQFGGIGGDRIDGKGRLQVVQKGAADRAAFGSAGPMYAVCEFSYADGAVRPRS